MLLIGSKLIKPEDEDKVLFAGASLISAFWSVFVAQMESFGSKHSKTTGVK